MRFTPNQIINQNFWVSIIDLLSIIGLAFISYKIHPLKNPKGKIISIFYLSHFFSYNVKL